MSTALEEPNRPLGRPSWRGMPAVLRRCFAEMVSDRISMVAAGCAFYATLSLFPAISMLISIYGLVFDPSTIGPQLQVLQQFLPPAAYGLIADRVQMLVSHPAGGLRIGLVVSAMVAFWSATTGTKSMLSALNAAYEETEKRGMLRYQITALLLTLAAIIAASIGLAVLVGLPAVLAFIGISQNQQSLIRAASFAILMIFVVGGLAALYRLGPSRRVSRWRWVLPGSIVAALLWVVASWLFSYYVGHIAQYDATYGPLGAVVGVMMWFFVTVFVMLLGAELNSELEAQALHDSSDPPGMRPAANAATPRDAAHAPGGFSASPRPQQPR